MRTSLIKGLVDTLGERGRIALPLLEQLLPVIGLGDLPKLGSPVGIPVRSYAAFAGTAGERSAMIYSVPAGYLLRIDGIMSNTTDAAISFGRFINSTPTSSYTIVDWRKRVDAGDNSAPGLIQAGLASSETGATWIAGLGLVQIGLVVAEDWYPGPLYVSGASAVVVWHTADNQAGSFTMIGEVFELG